MRYQVMTRIGLGWVARDSTRRGWADRRRVEPRPPPAQPPPLSGGWHEVRRRRGERARDEIPTVRPAVSHGSVAWLPPGGDSGSYVNPPLIGLPAGPTDASSGTPRSGGNCN